jgi:ribose 5-phosphate isomerase B
MSNDVLSHDAPVVALACDHAGFPLKATVRALLESAGCTVLDRGTDGAERVDYPDFAHVACRDVEAGRARLAVLICGSGVGMSIAANRHAAIRCVLAQDATTARLSRAHNDANALALGARLIGEEIAADILKAFLATPYEGGRHGQRIAKLSPPQETDA